MILNKVHLLTKHIVWAPKYNDGSLTKKYDELVALVHKKRVDFGTGIQIIEFPKAKHLQGMRFAIYKTKAQQCAVGGNGSTSPMYEIPISAFEYWETYQEAAEIAHSLAFDGSDVEGLV